MHEAVALICALLCSGPLVADPPLQNPTLPRGLLAYASSMCGSDPDSWAVFLGAFESIRGRASLLRFARMAASDGYLLPSSRPGSMYAKSSAGAEKRDTGLYARIFEAAVEHVATATPEGHSLLVRALPENAPAAVLLRVLAKARRPGPGLCSLRSGLE